MALPQNTTLPPPRPDGGSAALDDQEIAPKVTSVVPAIFIPLREDITQPFDVPRGRIERAKSVLESIEFHRADVRQGILHLTELERRRILRENRKWEAEHGPPENQGGVPPEEADAMIANMSAPVWEGYDYSIDPSALRPNFNAIKETPDRADTIRQLKRVMEEGLNHLVGYEGHMEGIKKRWTEALDKEEQLMEEKFGSSGGAGGDGQQPQSRRSSVASLAPTAPLSADDGSVPMDLDP
jgi:hypothetical protein